MGVMNFGSPTYESEDSRPKIYFSITSFENVNVSRHNSYTVYPLRIETSYKQWVVKHRYSEYRDLHKYLSK